MYCSWLAQVIANSIDELFKTQQMWDEGLYRADREDDAEDVWQNGMAQRAQIAVALRDFGLQLTETIPKTDTPRERQVFNVLAQQSLRMAGKVYEHLGYAYSRINRHDRAAEHWQIAADTALLLSGLARQSDPNGEGAVFSDYQAAARFQRAGYHWLIDGERDKSMALVERSIALVGQDGQRNLEALVNGRINGSINHGRVNDASGELSER